MPLGGEPPVAPRITIFTTPTCHWCRVAKRYLVEHRLPHHELDVSKDRRALKEMVLMTGQRGVPGVRVGSRAMIGWDEKEFERLLAGRYRHR